MLDNYLNTFKWMEETPKNYNLRHWICMEDVIDHTGLKIKLTDEGIHPYRNRFQFVKIDSGKVYVIDDFLKNPVISQTYELYMINPEVYNKEKYIWEKIEIKI